MREVDPKNWTSGAAVGPLPRGEWSIGKAFKHDKLGPVAMRLTPVGHKAHGRDSFLIQGENDKGF